MKDKVMTYESTKIEGDYLYGVWTEYFKDEDTNNIFPITRHEAVAYSDVVLKKKQSKLFPDKWAFYDYNPETMEFPVLVYYQWKKGKHLKLNKIMQIEKGQIYRANYDVELHPYHSDMWEKVDPYTRYPVETVRIIEKALKHDDEGVKAYTRKLAEFYRKEGKNNIADNILSYIGEAKVGMATMDETDQENDSKYSIFTIVPFKIETMSYLDAQEERLQGLKSLREKLYKLTLEWYEWELADHPIHQKEREEKLKDLYIQFHYRMQDHEQFMWDYEKDWDLNYQDYGLKKIYDSTVNNN